MMLVQGPLRFPFRRRRKPRLRTWRVFGQTLPDRWISSSIALSPSVFLLARVITSSQPGRIDRKFLPRSYDFSIRVKGAANIDPQGGQRAFDQILHAALCIGHRGGLVNAHPFLERINLKTRMQWPKIALFCSRVSICGSMGAQPEGPSRSDGISLMLSRLRRFHSRHSRF